jgi:hypothetical protein
VPEMTYRALLKLCWSVLLAFVLIAVLFALR